MTLGNRLVYHANVILYKYPAVSAPNVKFLQLLEYRFISDGKPLHVAGFCCNWLIVKSESMRWNGYLRFQTVVKHNKMLYLHVFDSLGLFMGSSKFESSYKLVFSLCLDLQTSQMLQFCAGKNRIFWVNQISNFRPIMTGSTKYQVHLIILLELLDLVRWSEQSICFIYFIREKKSCWTWTQNICNETMSHSV